MKHSISLSQFRCDNAMEMDELERLCGTRWESVKHSYEPKKAKVCLARLAEFADAVADCIPHDNEHMNHWDSEDALLWNVVCSMSNWSRSAIVAEKNYIEDEDLLLIDLATEVVYESIPHDRRVDSAYIGLRN